MVDGIDDDSLPSSAMLDTSVLVPALGKKLRTTDDPASKPLFLAMIRTRRRVLIAAPSAAEILRREPKSAIPRTPLVQVADFDRLAAELLGRHFPPSVLVEFRDSTKKPLHYIKYDAMIVACALRHRAAAFISTDDTQRKLASTMGLNVHAPSDYLAAQRLLFMEREESPKSLAPTPPKPEEPKAPK